MYEAAINRIIAILKSDATLKKEVKEWRFGDLPEQRHAKNYPAIYVTVSLSPQVSREDISPADGAKAPIQQVVTEYYAVIVESPQITADLAQKQAHRHRDLMVAALRNHRRLDDPVGTASALAPGGTEIHSTSRLTPLLGTLAESYTVMIRATTYEA